MRVIIAGGRDLTEYYEVCKAVHRSGFEITEVVSGGARGADTLGELWAEANRVPVKQFPADWKTHGRSAGPIRNSDMADYADALIAIPTGGPGTRNMIAQAKARGLKVHIHTVTP